MNRVRVSNCQLLWLTLDRMEKLKIIVVDEQAKHLCLWEPLKPPKLQKPMLTHTTILQYLFNFTQHFQSWLTLLPATCTVFVLRSVGLLHKLFYRDPCADFLRDCLSYLFYSDTPNYRSHSQLVKLDYVNLLIWLFYSRTGQTGPTALSQVTV